MPRLASLASAVCVTFLAVHLVASPAQQNSTTASHRAVQSSSDAGRIKSSASNYGKLPLRFEVNQGQTNARVKFLSRAQGSNLFLSHDALTITLPGARGKQALRNSRGKIASRNQHKAQPSQAVTVQLLGANAQVDVRGEDELAGMTNYYVGTNPKAWHTNIASYSRVRYAGLYRGIDLVYYGNESGRLEHDFIVRPGADPKQIAFSISGADPLSLDRNGDLMLRRSAGEVRFQKPTIYQESNGIRQSVQGRFILNSRRQVRFALAAYDRTRELVIDPVLTFATYVGGSGDDEADALAVDSAGNAYITGQTTSPDFPGASANSSTSDTNTDVFVTAIDHTGTSILYTTYLGGSDLDSASGIAVDSNGNAYVAGLTYSTDFPVSVGSLQANNAGNSDAFVTKVSPTGAVTYSTYLGGTSTDQAQAIAVDKSGKAFVAGITSSSDFPLLNALQSSNLTSGAFNTGFVTELDASGSALAYSTYFGGSASDSITGIAVDSSDNVYLTGSTLSTDFPTHNPLQSSNGGGFDGFVTKLNAGGASLAYSTYLGGAGDEFAEGIAIDGAGNAYVTGSTDSTDFPTQAPIQSTNTATAAYVTKIDATGSALVYSTYLGGTANTAFGTTGYAIDVDSNGAAVVAGSTDASDFPVTSPLQATNNGGLDAIVVQLSPSGSSVTYSTYLGGNNDDEAFGVALDKAGNTYLAGYTQSSDFPTHNPEQPNFAGGFDDAFVAKIPGNAAPVISNVPSPILAEASGIATTVTYSNPTAVDQANASVQVSCTPASGTTFPLGTTPVDCTATDSANAVAHASFTVTVQDTTAPAISNVPSPITAQATSGTSQVGWASPTALDVVDGNVAVLCAPASGSAFPVGTTTVQCSATDAANNTATASFTVTVTAAVTSNPPVLQLPANITAPATSASGAAVNYTTTATSSIDPNPTVVCTPASGSTFPVGSTTVNCTATDSANNSSSGSFTVTVSNAAPNANAVPLIDQPLSPSSAVPGGAAFTLTVSGTGFSASSVVAWNGSPRTTTFVSGSKLTANIPAANIAQAGTAVITVANPGPGGGTSNSISLPITSATQFVSMDRTDLFTTNRPTSVVSGDLDGDGKVDLIVANHDSNTVSVYMGKGDGTFAAAVDYDAAGSPLNLAVGDFDGNGKLDVAATLDGQDAVAIFLGNGDGTLQTAASFGTGSGPAGIAVGDVNHDGNLDVVVTNQGGSANSISVLLGNGDGTLQAKTDFGTGAQPSWVALGDFNGDGNLDVVAADSGSNKVSVLLGKGDATFAASVDYTVGSAPSSVVAADLNKDGVLDLAVANTSGSTISILKGKGDGTFSSASSIALNTAPNPVVLSVADLNGDGNLDLAFTTNGFPGASTLLGNGDATFQSLSYDFITTFGGVAQGLTVADFNGDGRLDLAVANPNDATVSILTQSPSVSLSANNLTFSGVKPGSNLSKTINLGNAGSAPLHIGSIVVSGGPSDFSATNDCGTVVAGGASCTITVKFAPTKTGNQFASLTVTDDAFDSPQSVFLNADGVTGPSSTTLSASLPSWTYGEPVNLIADVTANGGSGNPTGAVTFSDGNGWFGQAVVISGKATLNPNTLGSGIHSITATYQGDGNFSSSVSNSISVTVTPANATVGAIQSTINPSGFNQPVTFITKVIPQFGGIPTGRVNFYDGANLLGSAGINSNNGLVLLSTSLLDAGNHSITAQYVGDTNVLGNTSPALNQLVNQATTGTGVISLQAQAIVGQPITLRATVGSQFSGMPTGSVTFKRGAVVLGSVPMVNAQADFDASSFPVGTFTITALYSGDSNNKPSKGTTTQVVKRVATTTTIASAQNPGGLGQPVTFTATVHSSFGPPADGEIVTFKDGSITIGTGVLASGQATLTTSSLTMGAHTIKAVYPGDAGLITSSGVTNQKILAPTTSTLVASANPSVAGKSVKFTVKVTSPNGVPGSTVTFFADSISLGTKSLSAGSANITTSALTAGTHTITAQFNGGPKFAPSSTTINQDVQ